MLDTKPFDDAITKIQTQINSQQASLDADPTNIALKAIEAQAQSIRDLTSQLTDLQNKKSQAISADVIVQQKSQEVTDLTAAIPK